MLSWLQAASYAVGLLAFVFLAFVAAIQWLRWPYRKLPTAPGSRLVMGHARLLREDPIVGSRLRSTAELAYTYAAESGLIAIHAGPFATIVIVTSPDLIKEMYSTNRDQWEIIDRKLLKVVVGTGLLTALGESWRARRKSMNPAFHHAKLQPMSGAMLEKSEEMCARLAETAAAAPASGGTEAVVDIYGMLTAMTLDVIGHTAFGMELKAQTDLPVPMATLLRDMMKLTGSKDRDLRGRPTLPRARRVALTEYLKAVQKDLRPIIRARLDAVQSGNDEALPRDLLTALCQAKDENGLPYEVEDIVYECVGILIAGHDTTSTLAAWFIVAMADNPHVHARLVAELDAALGPVGSPIDASVVMNLPYLSACINETLRFHSPVPYLARRPAGNKPGLLAGKWVIPPETMVVTAPWITHHNPALWQRPEEFDPTRFMAGTAPKSRSPFAFMPFSVGARRCIGSQFAMMEAKVLLAILFHRFSFKVHGPVHAVASIVRRPKDGLNVTPIPRVGGTHA